MAPGVSRVPWYVLTAVAAVTAILIGAYWDISWHMSIGRDTFWSPPHIAIQLGGIIAGVAGSYLILTTTFRKAATLRDAGVRVLGFRGPLGAFLAVWGAATMVISAPFDNWWHAAYGLDVKILSPPHIVLTLGILGVATGSLLLIAAAMNRATGPARRRLEWMMLLVTGEVLVLAMTAIIELTFRANLHHSDSYFAVAIVVPLVFAAIGRVSEHRWAATAVAGIYTAFMLVTLWVFPLFPAEAKLGPVYQPITHFIPLQFPLLVIVPAVVIDLLRLGDRPRTWGRIRRAQLLGVVFLATLIIVQWPAASFLSSEAAHNRVFGSHYHPYMLHPDTITVRGEFMPQAAGETAAGLAWAVVVAMMSSWLGLVLGDALRRVRR
jgi:hypothetical protein